MGSKGNAWKGDFLRWPYLREKNVTSPECHYFHCYLNPDSSKEIQISKVPLMTPCLVTMTYFFKRTPLSRHTNAELLDASFLFVFFPFFPSSKQNFSVLPYERSWEIAKEWKLGRNETLHLSIGQPTVWPVWSTLPQSLTIHLLGESIWMRHSSRSLQSLRFEKRNSPRLEGRRWFWKRNTKSLSRSVNLIMNCFN